MRQFINKQLSIVVLKKEPLKKWDTNIYKSEWFYLNNGKRVGISLEMYGTLSIDVERKKNICIFLDRGVTNFEIYKYHPNILVYYKWEKMYILEISEENDEFTCKFLNDPPKRIIFINNYEERAKYYGRNIEWIYVKELPPKKEEKKWYQKILQT